MTYRMKAHPALTNSLSSRQESANMLMQCTLGLT